MTCQRSVCVATLFATQPEEFDEGRVWEVCLQTLVRILQSSVSSVANKIGRGLLSERAYGYQSGNKLSDFKLAGGGAAAA